jgi:hypothetical protein
MKMGDSVRTSIPARRTFRKTFRRIAIAASLTFLGAPLARAQNVMSVNILGGSGWNNLDNIPVGSVSAYGPGTATTGFATTSKNAYSPNNFTRAMPAPPTVFPGSLVQLKLTGSTVLSGTFEASLSSTETFNITQNAVVSIPTFLNGTINLGTLGLSDDTASVDESVKITNAAGATVGPQLFKTFVLTGNNLPSTVVNSFVDPSAQLGMGAYTATATLSINGAQVLSFPGLSDDFQSANNGMLTSIQAYPVANAGPPATGITDSRAVVGAPAARAAFFAPNANFAAVKVGILEPGNPFLTNTALPAAQVNIVYPGGAAAGTNYPDEHTLEVSGIIAANSANPAQAGIAPGATLYSASLSAYSAAGSTSLQALVDLAGKGVTVVNESAGSPPGAATTLNAAAVDQVINNNLNLTFVKSAGNTYGGAVTQPGLADNGITVGAMNNTDTQLAQFSSFGSAAGTPMKPDIVAPGSYILAPLAADTNGNGVIDDFGYNSLGASYANTTNPAPNNGAVTPGAGPISGTSFAAPMVSGAAAMLDQYAMNSAANTHTLDNRVIKAVLLNSATRAGITNRVGNPWTQGVNGSLQAGTYTVTQDLDTQLGAGMLNVNAAMQQFQPTWINGQQQANANNLLVINTALNTNAVPNTVIPYNPNSLINGNMWDQEKVAAGGRNDYLLGDVFAGHLRVTVCWDSVSNGVADNVTPVKLSLYEEGINGGNQPGFDAGDQLIATTMNAGASDNVDLFDFTVPQLLDTIDPEYFLDIQSPAAVNYGIAIAIPEPASFTLAAVAGAMLMRRSRRARS